jgi:hypothetical protein
LLIAALREAVAVPEARVKYWKERDARQKEFFAKNADKFRAPNGDISSAIWDAFSKAEKPFLKAAKEAEKAEKAAKSGKPPAQPKAKPVKATDISCTDGKEPKMVYGNPACVTPKR